MTRKVGLILGREWSFPPAFIEEVNRRDEGVVAEYVKLGAPRMDQPCDYAVIIDRISHEVPMYRTWLKQAVLQGCTVVNNPFMWTADDKFFGAALATKLGIAHPKTVVLPNKEYIPGIDHYESLRNLEYPLDWQGIVDYVGLPCVLKDAHGGGWKEVYICRSLEELIHHYDHSGLLTMVVQEFIEWEHFIRCICIGQELVMPIRYDPRERKYHVEHEHMGPELGRRVVSDSLRLVRALGYDMDSMEWAVKDGVPYAIDFMNPAPDMDIYSLTPHYFDWAVKAMADMAIRLAKNPRGQVRDLRWSELFTGSRVGGSGGYLGSSGREGGDDGAEFAAAAHAVPPEPGGRGEPPAGPHHEGWTPGSGGVATVPGGEPVGEPGSPQGGPHQEGWTPGSGGVATVPGGEPVGEPGSPQGGPHQEGWTPGSGGVASVPGAAGGEPGRPASAQGSGSDEQAAGGIDPAAARGGPKGTPAPADETGRTGDDTSPGAASRSTRETA
jgi:hypothetical protein